MTRARGPAAGGAGHRPARWPRAMAVPVAAVLAGLAQAASIAAPWNGRPQGWLQILSLAALVALLARPSSDPAHGTTARRAGLTGWLFATAWLTGTFWWLYVSMHTYGGLPAPLAVLAVLGLAAFLAIYYGVAAAAWTAWTRGAPLAWRAAVFAALWLVAELLRGSWFTGFPWGAGGYAHVDGLARRLAPWIGVYGVGAVAAFGAALAALACVAGPRRVKPRISHLAGAGVALAAIGLAALLPPASAPGAGQPMAVELLQGNIPQDEKFEPGSGVPLALDWYAAQLDGARAALVVAPETALPLLPQQLPDGYWDRLRRRFATGGQAALVGIPLGNREVGYSNSIVGLRPGTEAVYRYDKHHLVPFGEFIPPLFRWFTEMMNIPLGDFNRGPIGQPTFDWQGQRIAPHVCYEDLFGDEMAAQFRDPARAPTILANLSNIGWFGDTLAIDQHLQISRMRAIEFARPLIRATNTGATVVIDHRGQVAAELPRMTRAVLRAEVEGRGIAPGSEITPFARWAARLGLAPLWALGLGMAAAAALSARWRSARGRAA